MKGFANGPALDAGPIAGAQAIGHDKIACGGALRGGAKLTG